MQKERNVKLAGDITWDLERKMDGKTLEIWTVGKKLSFEDIDHGLSIKGLINNKSQVERVINAD